MLYVFLICACLFSSAQSMCYKYEPLYRNWTGSTSLSLVKISTENICRKAAQCSPHQAPRFGSLDICPLETLKPQPTPHISHGNNKQFYMNDFGGIDLNEIKFSTSNEQSFKSYTKEQTAQTPKPTEADLPVFTAMCFLVDDWSMCPRDSNVTNEDTTDDSPVPPLQYCYIMQRHEVDDDGICNMTLAPNEILKDLLHDDTEIATSNRNLVLFRINPVDEKCYVSNSTSMTSAEIDRCFPEDEKFEAMVELDQPTCDLAEKADGNNSTLKSNFSLKSIFLDRFQCGPL
uniref:Uncharacterized protein LOC100181165 n=1 Tax=Phallusia mammillata TaxID=59560 RepID=A0A6F9DI26_9ASCI|nr:uncharacterized protein LOC100181165 [Phallusia mammillata]